MVGVVVQDGEVRIISVGTQGPQGITGPPGSNSGVTVSPAPPGSPAEGDFWLNSANQELSIYANSVWEGVVYKSEMADANGNLILNGGNF